MEIPNPSTAETYSPLLGVRMEDPEINRAHFGIFLRAYSMAKVLRRIQIINGLAIPKEGSALVVVAPHSSLWDPPITYFTVAEEAGRSMRMVAADYVVDSSIPQDPKELARTGKKPHSPLKRRVISALSNIGHPISFNRSNQGREAMAEIDSTLNQGQIVGVALQETRKKPWEPNPARLGAAIIAHSHPQVPIIPVGIEGMERLFGPVIVRVGESFTVEELGLEEQNKRNLLTLHNKIVSSFEDLLPANVYKNLQRSEK